MYKIYCLLNENQEIVYVGMTSRNLKTRMGEHRRKFPDRHNYNILLLEECSNKEKAKTLEKHYIEYYKTFDYGENKNLGMGTMGVPNKTTFKKGNSFSPKRKIRCIETNKSYNSVADCARDMKIRVSNIYRVLSGERKSTHKYHFEYID